MIETHAHLYAEEFDKDRDTAVAMAGEKGVSKIYMPNVDSSSIDRMMEAELKYKNVCISTMGLHPCYVKKEFQRELYLVEDWLGKRKFAAIGEIGIDLYWDLTFRAQQEEAFCIQVELAKKYKLPIIIHCRNSFRETMDLLKPLLDGQLKGIFHCFGGTLEEANEVIEAGFLMGIGGVVTFKKAGLDQVIPSVSLDHLVLETDSPYLAPVPYRGKRNEPSYLSIIAQQIADYKQCSLQEVTEKTTANATSLFAL